MDPNLTPSTSSQSSSSSNSSYLTWIIIILIVLILLVGGSGVYLALTKQTTPSPHATVPTPTIATNKPQVKTTDLAPGLPNSQKTVVLIQHSDSSQEKIIMKTDLVEGYIKSLPEGEKAISQTSAGQ